MNSDSDFLLNNWILIVLWFFILYLLIKSFVKDKWERSPQQVIQLMNRDDALLLDVRESNELSEGYIEGSKHIPSGETKKRLNEVEKFKQKPLVVVCRSGHRSAGVLSTLRRSGFEQVYILRGGILAWQNDKLPLSK